MLFISVPLRSYLQKMNPLKTHFAVGVVIFLASHMSAQTLVDLGATAPTPGAKDISQLSTAGNQTNPDSLNYYTDNQTGHGTGEPGQTFTTGTNSAGYLLSSVALKDVPGWVPTVASARSNPIICTSIPCPAEPV